MTGSPSTWLRVPLLVGAVVIGTLAAAAGTYPWAWLAGANMRYLPTVPWGPLVMAAYLWLFSQKLTLWGGSVLGTRAVTNGVISYYFVCTDVAHGGIGPGDSGSSVFYFDASSGNGSWTGQAFAGNTPGANGFYTNFLFSPLNNIQSEFGTIPATIYGT